ncbi:winged helix-turn-helix domain-containing protein [Serratia marcescens]|uniref:winged helix-turn-helix domain-containing protein n=1 Tax=Serratia marcescens TaxID=615 RepID=UPI0013DBB321|nr:winged helix-turn-helix domain-containing protein [Serratia marcescens]
MVGMTFRAVLVVWGNMHYIINNIIEFNPEGRLLRNIKTNEEIKLYFPASVILLSLLNEPGKAFTYRELIARAWKRDEQTVSISTLHQNILNARSAFKKLGLDAQVIMSIPREGFRLCEEIKFSKVTTLKKHTNVSKNKFVLVLVLVLMCLSLFIEKVTQYSLFAFDRYYVDANLVIGHCKIYINSDSPTSNIVKLITNDIESDCKEKMNAYITFYQKDNYSILLCKESLPLGISKVCINKVIVR